MARAAEDAFVLLERLTDAAGVAASDGGGDDVSFVPYINVVEGALREERRRVCAHASEMRALRAALAADAPRLPDAAGADSMRIPNAEGVGDADAFGGDAQGGAATLAELQDALSAVQERAAALGDAYGRARALAARSGSAIAEAVHERARAVDTAEVLAAYLEMARGDGGRLSGLLGGPRALHGVALLRRLRALAAADVPACGAVPNPEEVATLIADAGARFERETLAAFHAALDAGNADGMRASSRLLFALDGGRSCVQSFVGRHAFFSAPPDVSHVRTRFYMSPEEAQGKACKGKEEPEDIDAVPGWAIRVSMADAAGVQFGDAGDAMRATYDAVCAKLASDWDVVGDAFADPGAAVAALLSRVFREPVAAHVDEAVRQGTLRGPGARLAALGAAWAATAGLCAGSWPADAPASSLGLCGRLLRTYAAHAARAGARRNDAACAVAADVAAVRTQLHALVREVFSAHLSDIVSEEEAHFGAACDLVVAAAAVPKRSERDEGGAAALLASVFRRETASQKSAVADPQRLLQTYVFEGDARLVSLSPSGDGVPRVDVASRLLVLHARALERLFVALPEPGRADALQRLSFSVLDAVLRRLVEACADAAGTGSFLARRDGTPASAVDAHLLAVAAGCARVLSLVMAYARRFVSPLLVASSPQVLRAFAQRKTDLGSRASGKVNALLRLQADGFSAWVAATLSARQARTDYDRRGLDDAGGGDAAAISAPTDACRAVCAALAELGAALRVLPGRESARALAVEAAGGVFAALVRHLRAQTVSETGGMRLQTDLAAYASAADALVAPWGAQGAIAGRFAALLAIGKVFVVRPGALEAAIADAPALARVDRALVAPYVSLRADYAEGGLDCVFPELEKSFERLTVS